MKALLISLNMNPFIVPKRVKLLPFIDEHGENVTYTSNTLHKLFYYLKVIQVPTNLISSDQPSTHRNLHYQSYNQNQYLAPNLSKDPEISVFRGSPRTMFYSF